MRIKMFAKFLKNIYNIGSRDNYPIFATLGYFLGLINARYLGKHKNYLFGI